MTAGASATRQGTELDLAFSSERAFRAWYDAALPRVYGFVLAHAAGDRELTEEITQQTFIDALRDHARFDGRSDVVTWLCAIARHKLADHYRQLDRQERRRLRLVVRELSEGGETSAWSAAEDRAEVEAALRTLPAMQRAALVSFYVDGLSMREIGRLVGRTETAVESLLTRARTNFRRAFREADDG
ncbi:MAG TPA: sigma-70 family RNA polymerase sigma factor [Candidatus Limnocylindrales bacterium]|nr:sigma-70 family RNA polymerase sigma factor [Candidatus Limnocylindrales bacterium]